MYWQNRSEEGYEFPIFHSDGFAAILDPCFVSVDK